MIGYLLTLILFFVKLWQKTRYIRSLFRFSQCRFYPSCSDYFLQSVKIYGLVYGGWLSLKRILRCNPLFECGVDSVPHKNKPYGFTNYRLCPIHSTKPIKRKELA